MAGEVGIAKLGPGNHLRQRVAEFFADPQLTLARRSAAARRMCAFSHRWFAINSLAAPPDDLEPPRCRAIATPAPTLRGEFDPTYADILSDRFELTGDFFDLVTFNHVAGLNIVVVFKRHTAFVAVLHVADIVLETPQLRQFAFVYDNTVAQ